MKTLFALVLAVSACVCAPASVAGTVTITSLNTLHLGWGATKDIPALRNTIGLTSAAQNGPQVILLQEVMPKYFVRWPADPSIGITPPGAYTFVTSAPAGRGNYLEQYMILIKNSPTIKIRTSSVFQNVAGKSFIRPPFGVLLTTGQSWTWVVDYHALFGKSLNDRRAELKLMEDVYNYFYNLQVTLSKKPQTFDRVVICGDWNVPVGDVSLQPLRKAIGAGAMISPAVQTSLNSGGVLSSSYDHCVWSSNNVTLNINRFWPVGSYSPFYYRSKISDHVPITGTLGYFP